MMQEIFMRSAGEVRTLRVPSPNAEVLPSVRWGRIDELMTPAYWKGQCWQTAILGRHSAYRLGLDLREEIAACLLGGWGMPAELGLAAFWRLRDQGLLQDATPAEILEEVLSKPLQVGGALRRYRFPRQRARHLAGCLQALRLLDEPESDRELRDALLSFPGLGWKTASWVVRNHRASSSVAIIDIHIVRAGQVAGVFNLDWGPQRHYRQLEDAFLQLAAAIEVDAALLDAVMWEQMRLFGDLALEAVDALQASPRDRGWQTATGTLPLAA